MKLNPELLKKAKGIDSVADLIKLAKEMNIEIDREEAAEYLRKLQDKLPDDVEEKVGGLLGKLAGALDKK